MRTHWSTLIVVDDSAGVVHDETARHLRLEELRAKGRMTGAFLTRVWLRHESPTDRNTWGPARREIDWDGFDPVPLPVG